MQTAPQCWAADLVHVILGPHLHSQQRGLVLCSFLQLALQVQDAVLQLLQGGQGQQKSEALPESNGPAVWGGRSTAAVAECGKQVAVMAGCSLPQESM